MNASNTVVTQRMFYFSPLLLLAHGLLEDSNSSFLPSFHFSISLFLVISTSKIKLEVMTPRSEVACSSGLRLPGPRPSFFVPSVSHSICLRSRYTTKFQNINKVVFSAVLLRKDFLGPTNSTGLNSSSKSYILNPTREFKTQLYFLR